MSGITGDKAGSGRDPRVIPPITDPMGAGWFQPDSSRILLDDTHAVMTRDAFKKLAEYSTTYPSGAYPGKMWKRHDGIFDHGFILAGGKPAWMLCWFGYSDKPGFVSNHHRLILICDDAEAKNAAE